MPPHLFQTTPKSEPTGEIHRCPLHPSLPSYTHTPSLPGALIRHSNKASTSSKAAANSVATTPPPAYPPGKSRPYKRKHNQVRRIDVPQNPTPPPDTRPAYPRALDVLPRAPTPTRMGPSPLDPLFLGFSLLAPPPPPPPLASTPSSLLQGSGGQRLSLTSPTHITPIP